MISSTSYLIFIDPYELNYSGREAHFIDQDHFKREAQRKPNKKKMGGKKHTFLGHPWGMVG